MRIPVITAIYSLGLFLDKPNRALDGRLGRPQITIQLVCGAVNAECDGSD